MDFKMKTLKDYFEEEYEAYEEPADNKRGFKIKYKYVGPLYSFNLTKREVQIIKMKMTLCLLISGVLVLAGSFQNREINYYSVSAALAAISMATLLFEIIGVVGFLLKKEVIRKQDYNQLEFLLKIIPAINASLLIAAMILGINKDAFVAILYGASGGFSLGIIHVYKMIRYEKRW
ncbi:MAG: hypothetical protein E7274_01115 [Pseudobutyrivibrio ruminis]|uniref:hypothetical protein n=1 Tax=Pseudobutyrivibrio ruminis TaxID=46206 RepID=UPI0026F0BC00|nr:hypothetical protein [Pseudobutyrivibrio ruminis]MBE5912644.1 hypothetical protein [Pseudobutyrivibrio ruminis]